ncbi:MAG: hypothetical protein IKH19_00235 [Muribaculaceae bacterium]|nr:hypothetical protein [Muribaculaceae bacterium]
MKKITLLLSLLLVALTGFQAKADLWMIGQISPYEWATNNGLQFTDLGDGNYNLDVTINSSGVKYFSLTTHLAEAADDWDAILPYRFGGGFEVLLDTPVTLVENTDASPYINFPRPGNYSFMFNVDTKTLSVMFREEIIVPPFMGTIYVTKNSVGNIYAWDDNGNYGDWPGNPISDLETATINGEDYYAFTYTHMAGNPGLIFNEGNEMPQTENIIPDDGGIYEYTGGNSATLVNIYKPMPEELFLVGSFNEWNPSVAEPMTSLGNGAFTIDKVFEEPVELKFVLEQSWDKGDYGTELTAAITAEQLGQGLNLINQGNNFQVPAGEYTINVDLNALTATFEGTIYDQPLPDTQVWILGDFVGSSGWTPYEGTLMTAEGNNLFTAQITTVDDKNWINFTKKLATDYDVEDGGWSQIAGYRIGATQSNDGTNNYVLHAQDMGTPIAVDQNAQEPITFQLPAGDWSLSLNLADNTITFYGDFPPEPEEGLFLVGSFNDWEPTTAEAFTAGEDGKFTIEKVFDTKTEVKFLTMQADWSADGQTIYGAESEGNFVFAEEYLDQPLSLNIPGENFELPAGTYTITVDKSAMTVTFAGEITPIVIEEGMFIVGSFNNWDAENPDKMEDMGDGSYTISKTFTENTSFKFVTDNSGWANTTVLGADAEEEVTSLFVNEDLFDWPLSMASPGANFMVYPGNYTITVSPSLRDDEGWYVTISGEIIIPETHIYILGEIDGKTSEDWTPYEGLEMTTEDFVTFEANMATTNDANYFNFTKRLATDYDVEDGGWSQIAGYRFGAVTEGGFADPFVVTADQMGLPLSLSEDCEEPTSFMLPAGDWHLVIDLMARTLTITGDFPIEETHVFILGEVNDNGGWFPNVGTEMQTEDYNTFTADITTAGENWDEDLMQGFSYFSFTKALAENDADNGGWDEIGVMRFGALTTEVDFLVTEEMIGQPLSLTQDGEGTASFKIGAGQWHLTMDLANRTLIIEQAGGLKGDVNGDGEVSIADITLLVSLIMDQTSNPRSDVNGDGETSVADITMLVDIVMNQSGQ